MPAREYNFDGLVGPTHNYAGLSHGNVASLTHAGQPVAVGEQLIAREPRTKEYLSGSILTGGIYAPSRTVPRVTAAKGIS